MLPCLDDVARLAFSFLAFVARLTRRRAAPQRGVNSSAAGLGSGVGVGLPRPASSGEAAQLVSTPDGTPATPGDAPVDVYEVDEDCLAMCTAVLRIGLRWLDTMLVFKECQRPSVDKSRRADG